MLLEEIVRTSEAVAATRSRLEKTERLVRALRGLDPEEVHAGVAFLAGELRQRQIGVGWAALRDLPAPATEPTLTVGALDAACARVGAAAGPGSQRARRDALEALFTSATTAEQAWLLRLLGGEVRQGASRAALIEAIARAAEVPRDDVRRAAMLHGDLGEVATVAFTGGAEALRAIRLRVGRAVAPMLASPAPDLDAALARTGPAAVEWKLDGARIQVHRDGGDVAVFTRSLDDITARVPEVVEAALALPTASAILDGEAIALRPDGRPRPFQETASRFGSSRAVEELRRVLPLTPLFFDVLHAHGEDLIDRPGSDRAAVLGELVAPAAQVPRLVTDAPEAAADFARRALAHGHEGVMVKRLASPYEAGSRGGAWLKVKPRHTLDLVILAAEWGHGRRRGWLSNLHLGARDPAGDGFVMLGKTFKGLTDEMLAWQTERLLALEAGRSPGTVHVRPELLAEVAFEGVQTSTRYPGGVTLRFARVLRHRPDKRPEEADTLASVLALRAAAMGPADEPTS